jgi:hypothetical protein
MLSTPEAGTIAARVVEAQTRLEEARAHFLAFDIALDATEHNEAANALRLAYEAARTLTRHTRELLEDVNGLLEWTAPVGVWVWTCLESDASPVQGDNADDYAGAYLRHFPDDTAARRYLATMDREEFVTADGEPAALWLVNHGTITAVWGLDNARRNAQ